VTEVVLTAGFLVVILGSTSSKVPGGFAPIAIGLALTLIHLISIPVTNTSVNPARSTSVAFYADTAAVRAAVAVLARAAGGRSDWRAGVEAAAGAGREPRQYRRAGHRSCRVRPGARRGRFAIPAAHAYSPRRQGA
jgi:hypothetical protein